MLSKMDAQAHVRTTSGGRWNPFDQTRMNKMRAIDSDANEIIASLSDPSANNHHNTSPSPTPNKKCHPTVSPVRDPK